MNESKTQVDKPGKMLFQNEKLILKTLKVLTREVKGIVKRMYHESGMYNNLAFLEVMKVFDDLIAELTKAAEGL